MNRTAFTFARLVVMLTGAALVMTLPSPSDVWPDLLTVSVPAAGNASRPIAAARPTKTAARQPATRAAGVRKKARRASRSKARAGRVTHRLRYVRGRAVHVVYADLNSPHVRVAVATAGSGIGSFDSWSGIINRTRPTAAITGTYFDVASALPVGTIVSRGTVIHRGGIGSSLGVRRDNKVEFAYHRPGVGSLWDGYETALRAGPRLVVDGRIRLTPAWEGFRDRAIYARKPRAAVGLTKHNKLLLVTVRRGVLLREMAAIMQDLGAVEALCMDGGSSAGLYCRGKSYLVPRRSMTNLLVIYDSSAQYKRFAPRLVTGHSV